MEIYQISVFLENQAGKLAEVTNILAENGIDLRAINIAESSDYGVLRVITSDAEKAVEILRGNNFIVNCTAVLGVSVPDKPVEKSDQFPAYSIAGCVRKIHRKIRSILPE